MTAEARPFSRVVWLDEDTRAEVTTEEGEVRLHLSFVHIDIGELVKTGMHYGSVSVTVRGDKLAELDAALDDAHATFWEPP